MAADRIGPGNAIAHGPPCFDHPPHPAKGRLQTVRRDAIRQADGDVRRTAKTTLRWGRTSSPLATTQEVRNDPHHDKRHEKLRTAGSPHPGDTKPRFLGRSSDSPSSSSGAFPREIRRAVARHRSRQAYSSGGCAGMSAPEMRGFTGFPFHPPRDRGARNPKTRQSYACAFSVASLSLGGRGRMPGIGDRRAQDGRGAGTLRAADSNALCSLMKNEMCLTSYVPLASLGLLRMFFVLTGINNSRFRP
jgi:hypothetical protein